MTAPALRACGVGVRYGERTVLRDVSFEVWPGEVVAVIGPNGSGKSSLFKALVGLVSHAGCVEIHGRECHHRTHRLGAAYIPQRADVDLAFPITVREMVALGRRPFRRWHRRATPADHDAVDGALDRVGLVGFGRRPLGTLSGGELQRAFLARAIAQEAEVLLLDEALSGVDQPRTEAMLMLLDGLARDGTTVLIATHDLALTRRRFGRCLAVNGRLVADGVPSRCLEGAPLEATFGTGLIPSEAA
jgi:ABC-type Mn2+/Zn2+ transport system ATPase subunit